MLELKKTIKENQKSILIGVLSAITILLIILPIRKGVAFQNNVEYKDLFTLILNVVFIFFISKSLTKDYDSQRKKKDILIEHIKSDYDSFKEKISIVKTSNYAQSASNLLITAMREDVELLKQIITEYYSNIDLSTNFQNIQSKLRSIDRIIIPSSSSFQENLTLEHTQLIDENIRIITKSYFEIINAINNI